MNARARQRAAKRGCRPRRRARTRRRAKARAAHRLGLMGRSLLGRSRLDQRRTARWRPSLACTAPTVRCPWPRARCWRWPPSRCHTSYRCWRWRRSRPWQWPWRTGRRGRGRGRLGRGLRQGQEARGRHPEQASRCVILLASGAALTRLGYCYCPALGHLALGPGPGAPRRVRDALLRVRALRPFALERGAGQRALAAVRVVAEHALQLIGDGAQLRARLQHGRDLLVDARARWCAWRGPRPSPRGRWRS
jgi:hypothetical protein